MAQRPKRATSADVAARAGVSRTTVSFVLNGRAGRRHPRGHAAAGRGRRPGARLSPARRRAGAGRRHLAHDRPRPAPVARPGLGRRAARGDPVGHRVRGARGRLPRPRRAALAGRRPLQRPRRARSTSTASSCRVPGSTTRSSWRSLERASRSSLQGSLPSVAVPSVDVDNRGGRADGRRATCSSWATGGSRASPTRRSPTPRPPDRLAGYRDALDAASVAYATRRSSPRPPSTPAAATRRWGSCCARAPDVTAAFVASDVVAFGAIGRSARPASASRGTSRSWASTTSPLARHSSTRRSRRSACRRSTSGPPPAGHCWNDSPDAPVPERTLLPTELIVRTSTAPRG